MTAKWLSCQSGSLQRNHFMQLTNNNNKKSTFRLGMRLQIRNKVRNICIYKRRTKQHLRKFSNFKVCINLREINLSFIHTVNMAVFYIFTSCTFIKRLDLCYLFNLQKKTRNVFNVQCVYFVPTTLKNNIKVKTNIIQKNRSQFIG